MRRVYHKTISSHGLQIDYKKRHRQKHGVEPQLKQWEEQGNGARMDKGENKTGSRKGGSTLLVFNTQNISQITSS